MTPEDLAIVALAIFAWECLRQGFRALRDLVRRQEVGEMVEECPRCGRLVPHLAEHLPRCQPRGHGGVYTLDDLRRRR